MCSQKKTCPDCIDMHILRCSNLYLLKPMWYMHMKFNEKVVLPRKSMTRLHLYTYIKMLYNTISQRTSPQFGHDFFGQCLSEIYVGEDNVCPKFTLATIYIFRCLIMCQEDVKMVKKMRLDPYWFSISSWPQVIPCRMNS